MTSGNPGAHLASQQKISEATKKDDCRNVFCFLHLCSQRMPVALWATKPISTFQCPAVTSPASAHRATAPVNEKRFGRTFRPQRRRSGTGPGPTLILSRPHPPHLWRPNKHRLDAIHCQLPRLGFTTGAGDVWPTTLHGAHSGRWCCAPLCFDRAKAERPRTIRTMNGCHDRNRRGNSLATSSQLPCATPIRIVLGHDRATEKMSIQFTTGFLMEIGSMRVYSFSIENGISHLSAEEKTDTGKNIGLCWDKKKLHLRRLRSALSSQGVRV